MKAVYLVVTLLAFASALVQAYDPSPLQDFCVALNDSATPRVFVNGKVCKDPKVVEAEDFFFSGLDVPGNTSNRYGSNVTDVDVNNLPGLNTLGISLERIDFAPKGLNPLHSHPRGSEFLVVIEGTLLVGFVTSNQDNNRFFSKQLKKGDVFLFPMGLFHFQYNLGDGNAVAISGLSSQNPGEITVAKAAFGSDPRIFMEVLEKNFQVNETIIRKLEEPFPVPH